LVQWWCTQKGKMATMEKRSGKWRVLIRRKFTKTISKTFVTKEDADKYAPKKVVKKPLPNDWKPKYLNDNVIDITPLLDDEWWSIFGEDPPKEESRLLLVPKSKAEGIRSILNLHKKFVG